jgi:hypothetical protein
VSPRPLRPSLQISLVLGLVILLIGVGVVDHALTPSRPTPPAAAPISAVPAADVESSAWYCAGGSGGAGSSAVATIDLVNTAGRRANGVISVVTDQGVHRSEPETLAPHQQSVITPSSLQSGSWVAASLQFEGGGVLVSQSVDGPDGWSTAPCARTTAPAWYFASGATEMGETIALALFNPTAATAVVDLSFITPSAVLLPQPFQGVVVKPGGLVVEQVALYVQDQTSVSTIVSARAGQVVADETDDMSVNGVHGLSLRLGTPNPEPLWALPRSVDVSDGTTTISICNPTMSTEHVTVQFRLASGRLAPLRKTLPAQSTWALNATALVRIPKNTSYSAIVRSSGAGVVVDRSVSSGSTGAPPQFGAQTAVAASGTSSVEIVAAPGTESDPAVTGAGSVGVGLLNLGAAPVSVTLSSYPVAGAPSRLVRRVVVGPSSFQLIGQRALLGLHRRPLVVRANGPVVAMADFGPVGSPGVVGLAAVPLEGA